MKMINVHDYHRDGGDYFKTRAVENVLFYFFVIFVKSTKET